MEMKSCLTNSWENQTEAQLFGCNSSDSDESSSDDCDDSFPLLQRVRKDMSIASRDLLEEFYESDHPLTHVNRNGQSLLTLYLASSISLDV